MTPTKFLFDNTFDGEPRAAAPRPRRALSAEDIEKIKADAFIAGASGVEARAAQTQSLAVGRIAESIIAVLRNLDSEIEAHRKSAMALAHAIGRKLAGAALSAFPDRIIESVIGDCLSMIPQEPRIVVRTSPEAVPPLKDAISRIAGEHGFGGRIVIIGENGFAKGDCRIEWADGGLERNLEAIDTAITEALAHDGDAANEQNA